MHQKLPLLSLFFGWFLFESAAAQPQLADSVHYHQIIDSLLARYRTGIGENAPLYNGSEYMGYVRRPKGHPFFESDLMQSAQLKYEGILYNDSILYDLVNDAVVIRNYGRNYNLNLVNEKISDFTLMGHFFVRLEADTTTGSGIGPGFYERLYNGSLAVFVKRKKQINAIPGREEVVSEYVQYNYFFIRKNNSYVRVTNKRSLLSILKEHKSEVRKFLRRSHLNFKKDADITIAKAVAYFDQLKK